MDQTNKTEFKLCKTCNIFKEITKYRPKSLKCKQCNNKIDALNHLKRNKTYYEKHRDRIIKHNTDNYFKNKLLKEQNIESGLCF